MDSHRRRTLVLFYTAKVLANLAAFAFLPLLPLYLTRLDAGIVQVGIFFSALAVARLLFGIAGGWLADRLGHLRALAAGSVFGAGAFLVLITAPGWAWVLPGMVLIYAASALTTPSQSAFIGGQSESHRGRAFGLMNTIHTAAQTGGPLLGGWLAETMGFSSLFRITGAMYLAGALIRIGLSRRAAVKERPSEPAPTGLRESLGQMAGLVAGGGLLAWMLLADGLGDISMSLTETYQPILLEGAGISVVRIGLIGSIAYGANLFSHAISGWLVDRYGERLPVLLSFGLTGCAILGFTGAHTFAGFAVSWALVSLMWGFGATAYDSLISKAVPARHRGLAYGIFSTAQGFFSLPMPLIGGWLYLWGSKTPFIAAAAASFAGTLLVLRRFPGGNVPDQPAASESNFPFPAAAD